MIIITSRINIWDYIYIISDFKKNKFFILLSINNKFIIYFIIT